VIPVISAFFMGVAIRNWPAPFNAFLATHWPMNVLVTGGCGFIGSNLVKYLRTHRPQWKVVNLDKLTYAGNLENLTDLEKDPCTCSCGATSATGSWSITSSSSTRSTRSCTWPPRATWTAPSSAGGLHRGQRAGHQRAPRGRPPRQLSRFLMVSTDEVYGSLGPTGHFTETTPLDPSSPYSSSKAAADLITLAYERTFGLDVVVTRCSNNYGPYQFPEKLIPLMVANAINDKPLPVYGDGTNVRDWLHVEDHCAALPSPWRRAGRATATTSGQLRAAEHPDRQDHPRRRGQARDADQVRQGPARSRQALRHRRLEDHRRAGLGASHVFEQALAETVKWYWTTSPGGSASSPARTRAYFDTQYAARLKG